MDLRLAKKGFGYNCSNCSPFLRTSPQTRTSTTVEVVLFETLETQSVQNKGASTPRFVLSLGRG